MFKLIFVIVVFLIVYFLPVDDMSFHYAIKESLGMLREYAREHVLFCLIPAFFIAGAMVNFINRGTVIKYLGAGAKRIAAYSIASVSGSILSVCSCTVLPLV